MKTQFTPTWLYIKQHNATGLKYFGKTTRDPVTYKGSGLHWCRHLSVHGNNVTTVWSKLFDDEAELVAYALQFSVENNIVESAEWANLKVENGLDGNPKGIVISEASRKKMSASASKPKSTKWKEAASINRTGKLARNKGVPHSEETRLKISAASAGENNKMFGRKHSDDTRRLMAEARKGKPPSNKGVKLTEEQKLARRLKMEERKRGL